MRITYYILAVKILLISSAFAQATISSRTDSLIKKGIRLSIAQSYAEAIAIFKAIKTERPDSPIGYFFHAAVLQTQMMDVECYDQEKEFLSLIDSTMDFSKQQIRKSKKNGWAYFFLGGAYGYLSFYRAKQKKFWEAFQNGKRSVEALEMALKTDSTLYDAYLGLGSYKYYRSHLSRHFSWVPFIKNDRKEALEMIRLAMHKSQYSQYSAMNGLCWVLLEEERYEDALEIIRSALEEFPNSRVFLWCAAKSSKKLHRWYDAVGYYEKILNSFKNQNIESPYNELTCHKNLSKIYRQLKDHEKADEECKKVSEIQLNRKAKKQYPGR